MLISHVFEVLALWIILSIGIFLESSKGVIQECRHQTRILIFTFLVIAIVENLNVQISSLLLSCTHNLDSLDVDGWEWLKPLHVNLSLIFLRLFQLYLLKFTFFIIRISLGPRNQLLSVIQILLVSATYRIIKAPREGVIHSMVIEWFFILVCKWRLVSFLKIFVHM